MFWGRNKELGGIGRAVQRTTRVDGLVLPAFIHNGGYYFINLPVYADGLVDAWEFLDRQLFEKKLAEGWVTTAVPDGESIRVHGLGSWVVQEGKWDLTPRQLAKCVQQCVRELNPDMTNLYDFHGTTTRKVGKVNVAIFPMAKAAPVRPKDESFLPRLASGSSLSVLSRVESACYLADLRLFEDGTAELGRLPVPRTLHRDELQSELSAGRLFTKPASGERVSIHGLGSFRVATENWSIETNDLASEIEDVFAELTGKRTTLQVCRALYDAFLTEPTSANRDALRKAYEAVPAHNRMYLGDMDVKDIPIRMVIYGKEELENWSHRAVARAQGAPVLPTITVPDVEDDGDA